MYRIEWTRENNPNWCPLHAGEASIATGEYESKALTEMRLSERVADAFRRRGSVRTDVIYRILEKNSGAVVAQYGVRENGTIYEIRKPNDGYTIMFAFSDDTEWCSFNGDDPIRDGTNVYDSLTEAVSALRNRVNQVVCGSPDHPVFYRISGCGGRHFYKWDGSCLSPTTDPMAAPAIDWEGAKLDGPDPSIRYIVAFPLWGGSSFRYNSLSAEGDGPAQWTFAEREDAVAHAEKLVAERVTPEKFGVFEFFGGKSRMISYHYRGANGQPVSLTRPE